jgi:hypothetical protein
VQLAHLTRWDLFSHKRIDPLRKLTTWCHCEEYCNGIGLRGSYLKATLLISNGIVESLETDVLILAETRNVVCNKSDTGI